MSENPAPKRKIMDSYYTSMPLVEKKQYTFHRLYSALSRNNNNTSTMKFSMKVVNYILQQNLITTDPKNIICSPLSLDSVLNMLALGSKGDTLRQLLHLNGSHDIEDFNAAVSILGDVLKESKGDDDGPEICFANALWVDQHYPLKKSFQEIVRDLHKAEATSVDFVNKPNEVIKEANLWAEKQSKGFIKEILSEGSLEKDTVMLLANALYFKGTWVERFKPENTKDQDYYLLNGEKVQVPFMNMEYTNFDYGTFKGCQVLRMLYNEEKASDGVKSRSFSMYIILPKKIDGLPDLLDKIQKNSTLFMDKMKLEYRTIKKLAIPKFKFDCNVSLKATMMELGLTLPFDRNSKDITEMVESPFGEWLFVDEIFQKSYVEVNEEGTKAVTLTMLSLCGGGCAPPPVSFVADHPFVFLIREDYTGAVLFMGTVLNP